MHSYSRFPVALDRGKGATLWDAEVREYIDFTSGIGVASLGMRSIAGATRSTRTIGPLSPLIMSGMSTRNG